MGDDSLGLAEASPSSPNRLPLALPPVSRRFAPVPEPEPEPKPTFDDAIRGDDEEEYAGTTCTLVLSYGGDGGTVVVVGMRNAAEGSYFFRASEELRDIVPEGVDVALGLLELGALAAAELLVEGGEEDDNGCDFGVEFESLFCGVEVGGGVDRGSIFAASGERGLDDNVLGE